MQATVDIIFNLLQLSILGLKKKKKDNQMEHGKES